MTPRRLLAAVVLGFSAVRLALAFGVGVGNDEAYHALLATHLDWSYFDHPPMLALVARLGIAVGGLSPLALRAGFVALFAGSTLLMFRLASRLHGEWPGVIAAVALNAAGHFGLAVGTFALPDGPLLFFSLLTLDRLAVAIDRVGPGSLGPWVAVGLAWGGGMLSKYHAVFLPIGVLGSLLSDRTSRARLRTPGPWLALGIGLAVFSPVIAWNALHGWSSFRFQGGRAAEGASFRPALLLAAVGGQALYVFPWIWAFLAVATVRSVRRGDRWDRFLLWQAFPPLLAFLIVGSRRQVLPHWSLAGLVPLFPLIGRDWVASRRLAIRLAIFTAVPVAVSVLFVAQARWGVAPLGATDPTADTVGWNTLVAEMKARGWLDRPGQFVFTSKWYDSGQIAFASGGHLHVTCYAPRGGHAFEAWTDPTGQVGRDGLLVVIGENSTEPAMYDRWFARIVPLGEVAIHRRGVRVRRVRVYRCEEQLGPFPGEVPGVGLGGTRPRG